MIEPRVERVPEPRQHREALAEFRVAEHAGHRRIARIAHLRIVVPRGDVADAAEAPAAGAHQRLEHRLDAAAEHQVGMSDDAGAGADLAVDAARRHRGDAVDELDLADRLHLLRPVGALHRARLHEHGREDVVAAVGVGEQIVEQVAPALAIPQVMMRIDDRQVGLEDRLLAPGEPVVADVEIVRGLGRALRLRHGTLPAARVTPPRSALPAARRARRRRRGSRTARSSSGTSRPACARSRRTRPCWPRS